MKKIFGFALLFLLGTLAFGQCMPPVVNGVPQTIGPGSAPDYFACGNYASSPLPKRSCSLPAPAGTSCYGDLECAGFIDPANPTVVSTCSGPITSGGIRKFVDTLPGLGPSSANNLGQYIPVATPDITTYPGSDYYEIALVEYTQKLHSDLPATKLRGYIQLNHGTDQSCLPNCTTANNTVAPDPNPHYLGPTILSQKDRPVRILFRNQLPAGQGGNLFLPVDTTVMGSGMGPDMGGMTPTDLGVVTDQVRNPMCGMNPKPAGCFTENRATLHLHGGITPWISDGTPHQWITPADETTPYPDATLGPRKNEGVSVVNVPDMPDPGPGAQTFFYTNQQSARLMFYHDHAWGVTRLNVYAGEAAGYVVTDPTEQALMAAGGPLDPLGYGIPLIIQDKTFVPTPDQLVTEDPTWDTARWGGLGALWVPHVYMPAQNPGDVTGMSGFGRWMYGPWFWPPASPAFPPIANPYFDPLCDANVTGWCQPPLIPSTPNQSVGMEAFNDTPLVNGTPYPTVTLAPGEYRFRILNAANDRFWNLQWYVADATGTEVALKATELAAAQIDPNIVPTPDTLVSPAGPAWIQIGTEGGFLPAPVVVPNQPTTWIIDPTRFDVGNVDKHALLLAPAERADVVVDLTPFAGKTLILYNDAPAAFPARVATYDYYTGNPDQTDAGGAPATQPGFGPNTRTIMRVVVSGAGGTPTPNYVNPTRLANLQAAFAHHLDANGNPAGVFESSMDPIIVAQGAYNSAYGTNFNRLPPRDGYARIADMQLTFNTLLTGNSATNTMTMPFENKGLHDEMNAAVFDEFGRMTANLGLEAPGATPLTQNIILYPYINPPTELLKGIELPSGSLKVDPIASATDGTQIWKLTHNGVDTHPIHFHMFNVQLLNRVTWDNRILPPDATELGWKDTVRVSPLEDTIVALRPIVPKIPFGVPDSNRPLNPAMPLGNTAGFNNTDPLGNPMTVPIANEVINFGWEYVWHCHILGHEEMDMMRPMSASVSRALPVAPVVTATRSASVVLTWTDGTPVDYTNPSIWGDPTNEIGFRIERADVTDVNTGAVGPYAVIGTALANQITFTDSVADPALPYSYRVVAYNAAGDSVSLPVVANPAAPTTTTIAAPAIAYGLNGVVTVTVTSTQTVTGDVTLSVDGGAPITLPLVSGSATFNLPLLPLVTVGSHSLAANFAAQGTFAASSATGTLTVNPAVLTVTASNAAMPFGGPVPTITATITGFVNGETAAVLTTQPTCSTTATTTSAPGPYPSTCTGAVAPNYTFNYVPGTVTVGVVTLTITASSASVLYGAAVPAITPSYAGFVPPDNAGSLTTQPTCSVLGLPAGNPVGTYTTQCSGAVSANYTIVYVSGTLTITPAPLTITANNATRAYRTANPAFTVTYAGFVNGNTPASLTGTLTCITSAVFASQPGTYPITCSGLTSPNYTITFVPGVLTVTGPVLAVAPTSLAFSSSVNVTSLAQTVTVSNTGTAALRINSIGFGGANPGRFGQTNNCPIGLPGLGVGASCTVNVTFTPNNTTTRTATLNVNVAAPAVSRSVTLTGTTTRPTVSVTPTAIPFGTQPINTTSAPQTVTVQNTSTVPLVINGITLGGANPNRFGQSNTCPIGGAGLQAGASCTISVTFTPNRRVARSATLTIRDNAANSPQTVTLTGTGI